MSKSRKAKQKQKDARVTAPLISWRAILIIFGIMYFLVVGQSFIVAAFLDQVPVLVSVLGNYLLCTCVLLAVLFGLFLREDYFVHQTFFNFASLNPLPSYEGRRKKNGRTWKR